MRFRWFNGLPPLDANAAARKPSPLLTSPLKGEGLQLKRQLHPWRQVHACAECAHLGSTGLLNFA